MLKKFVILNPSCFSPRPKIESSLFILHQKKIFIRINDPKNIEKITRVFFNHRRKMLKKPFNQLFNGNQKILR